MSFILQKNRSTRFVLRRHLDRAATNPNQHLAEWQGILQADAYGGYNDLYRADRDAGPVTNALCWAHARRKFFELADIKATARKGKKVAVEISPIALETVQKIDAIFDIERELNGLSAADRYAARQELVRPLIEDLHRSPLATPRTLTSTLRQRL